jgi:hypothetical protein
MKDSGLAAIAVIAWQSIPDHLPKRFKKQRLSFSPNLALARTVQTN